MAHLRGSGIRLFDTVIRQNRIHQNLDFLKSFYLLSNDMQHHIQEKRLKDVLNHAFIHVPYYRQLLQEVDVFVDDEIHLQHFQKIPFLTRTILQEYFDKLSSDDLDRRKWYINASGGSTGEPVRFIQDVEYSDWAMATQLLQRIHVNWELGERFVTLWGSQRDITHGNVSLKTKLANFLRNRTLLNCFSMTDEQKISYIKYISELKPVLLEAYADCAYDLARFMNQHSLSFSGIRSVITSAGNLHPFMREEIEKACNCSVHNRYGCREIGGVAIEVQLGAGLKVYGYTNFVEVIDEQGNACKPGQEGEIVVTSLSNYAMPLIRYRIGDRAVVGERNKQSTGHVNTIQDVAGRVTDSFLKRDGTVISSAFFIHFLGVVHNSGWLQRAQIIQEDYDQIQVKLIVNTSPSEQSLIEIRDSIKSVMGTNCQVKFEYVDDIPCTSSGKYRYTISLVPRT